MLRLGKKIKKKLHTSPRLDANCHTKYKRVSPTETPVCLFSY